MKEKLKNIVVAFTILTWLAACSGRTNTKLEMEKEGIAAEKAIEDEREASLSPKMRKGKGIYTQYCQPCHQRDGKGQANLNPPLSATDWVTGDKNRLIGVLLNGLSEELEINGIIYNNVMASHEFLTDEEIAAVLTYIRQSFGNNAIEVTAEEVRKVRQVN